MTETQRQAPDLSSLHPVMAAALRPLFGFKLPAYPEHPAKFPAGTRPAQRYSYAECTGCDGSGEGRNEGARCMSCGGSGESP